MKKLLYSIFVLASVGIACFAAAPPGYFPGDNLWSTNILMNTSSASNEFRPGQITLRVTPTAVLPLIRLIGTNSVASVKLYDAVPNTLELATHVRVDGDLTASGTVTGSGLVFSVTNITFATNAWFATNAPDTSLIVSSNVLAAALADTNLYKLAQSYYPTNLASTNTDMSVPYGDVNWAVGFYWPLITGKSATNYQTAVRMLHATGAPVGGTNFGVPVEVNVYGSTRITNETICTFFYNPATDKTNLLCLPLY